MGKSAKIRKRTVRPPHKTSILNPNKNSLAYPSIPTAAAHLLYIQKKKTSHAGTGTGTPTTLTTTLTPKSAAQATSVVAASAAKKAKLKGNHSKSKRAAKLRSIAGGSSSSSTGATGPGGRVLGGADYVDIMMGSRRREREEAMKLPRESG